jgi:hypothetical protein
MNNNNIIQKESLIEYNKDNNNNKIHSLKIHSTSNSLSKKNKIIKIDTKNKSGFIKKNEDLYNLNIIKNNNTNTNLNKNSQNLLLIKSQNSYVALNEKMNQKIQQKLFHNNNKYKSNKNNINKNAILNKNIIPKFNLGDQLYSYSYDYYKDIKHQNSLKRNKKNENENENFESKSKTINNNNNENENKNDKENQIENFGNNDINKFQEISINKKKDFEKSYIECIIIIIIEINVK